jgi:hypothetical protein
MMQMHHDDSQSGSFGLVLSKCFSGGFLANAKCEIHGRQPARLKR